MESISEAHLAILESMDIRCSDIEKLVYELVEGELPDTLKQRVEPHISKCSACTEFVDTYRMVTEIAGTLVPKSMPREVKARLHERLNKELGLNL